MKGATKKAKFVEDADVYVMPWLGKLTDRLFVGPFPRSKEDVYHLENKRNVGLFINMRPDSDEETAKGNNKATWYSMFLEDGDDKKIVRDSDIMLPTDFGVLNEKKQIAYYLKAGKAVIKLIKEHRVPIYIHNETGCDEEAFLGFVVWAYLDIHTCPACPPNDLGAWLKEHTLEKLLDSEESYKEMLNKTMLEIQKEHKVENSMLNKWVIKKKI
jgi:hypothetical protein